MFLTIETPNPDTKAEDNTDTLSDYAKVESLSKLMSSISNTALWTALRDNSHRFVGNDDGRLLSLLIGTTRNHDSEYVFQGLTAVYGEQLIKSASNDCLERAAAQYKINTQKLRVELGSAKRLGFEEEDTTDDADDGDDTNEDDDASDANEDDEADEDDEDNGEDEDVKAVEKSLLQDAINGLARLKHNKDIDMTDRTDFLLQEQKRNGKVIATNAMAAQAAVSYVVEAPNLSAAKSSASRQHISFDCNADLPCLSSLDYVSCLSFTIRQRRDTNQAGLSI